MQKISIFVLALMILAGCGPTYQVGQEAGDIDLKEASAIAQDRNAALALRDGTRLHGSLSRITEDTLEFLEDESDTSMHLPVGHVRSMTMSGAKVWTTILGGVTGMIVGAAISQGNSIESLVVTFIGGMPIGGAIGGMIGYWLGPSTTILFASPRDMQDDVQAKEERMRAAKLREQDSLKNAEMITISVPEASQGDDFVSFVVDSRDICLPIGQVKLERVNEGVRITASRGTFKSGGLIFR
jgi:hypothetical protein